LLKPPCTVPSSLEHLNDPNDAALLFKRWQIDLELQKLGHL
jgi:hypothetical protein